MIEYQNNPARLTLVSLTQMPIPIRVVVGWRVHSRLKGVVAERD